MADLARLILLLLVAALFANVLRGTTRDWLLAKFLGRATAPAARPTRPAAPAAPLRPRFA